MNSRSFLSLVERLLRCPAAPYHESLVQAEVESICREHRLRCDRDVFGNLVVAVCTAPRRRPIVLSAHLDHPGFEITETLAPSRYGARFRGGVPDSFFRAGLQVGLFPGDVPARLKVANLEGREFILTADRPSVPAPAFGVWQLPAFQLRGRRIHGRACDDLIGVACVLATLIDLKAARASVNVVGMLTRAEEVGFHGALAAARAGGIPKRALVISLETSRELPPVKMGKGVILRVGDKASVFDSTATRYLAEVAADLSRERRGFHFQRALMSGGTCEGTAYQECGFQTAALCVALGNYHNCGADRRIAAEYVDTRDAMSLVRLLVAASKRLPEFQTLTRKLPRRLALLHREAMTRLRR